MVKPRYINNEIIVPKPGPKQIKDESYFIGHAPYEEDTTEVEVEVHVHVRYFLKKKNDIFSIS